MTQVTLDRPWLCLDLGQPMQVLSWAVNNPGFVLTRRILWREVRNADLPETLDVKAWFETELDRMQTRDAVAFLTSCDIGTFQEVTVKHAACTAQCVATVGLSNAERVGHHTARMQRTWGTINIAVRLDCGLSRTGLIEAVSIAAQARTAAIMDIALPLPAGPATGTGTDCIAIAAPEGGQDYVGLHTDIGAALGATVYRATYAGARHWMDAAGHGDCPRQTSAPAPAERSTDAR